MDQISPVMGIAWELGRKQDDKLSGKPIKRLYLTFRKFSAKVDIVSDPLDA